MRDFSRKWTEGEKEGEDGLSLWKGGTAGGGE